jgi:hypothetical protein
VALTNVDLEILTAARTAEVLTANEIVSPGAPADLAEGDCQRILRSFQHSHRDTHGLLFLFNHKRLRDFVESRNSSALLIRDDSRRKQGAHLAISFATAMVVQYLRAAMAPNPRDHVLAFFCNIPTGAKEVRTGKTMMIQLVSQLMLEYNGLTTSILGNVPTNIENASTGRLLRLFSRLLQQLPYDSRVYCIIDSFDPSLMWERSKTGDTDILGGLLGLLAEAASEGPMLKILFTTSRSSLGFAKHLEREDVLDMGISRKSARQLSAKLGHSQISHTAVWQALEAVSRNRRVD